ncbi:hypothetical protein O9929_09645 [Vibrio lentus]|nr:hypothetical protein [Vibrio lentus]
MSIWLIQKETKISGSHVLSVAETTDQYWIGTEHGLISYNFITGEITRFEQAANQDFSLPGEKIYSLINDHAGGMWVWRQIMVSVISRCLVRLFLERHLTE